MGTRLPPTLLDRVKGQYWLPDVRGANRDSLTEIWQCGEVPTFVYPSASLAFEPGWSSVRDPERRWAAMAEQWGRGRVGTALGRPAFLEEPSDGYGPEICVIVEDTLVRAIGRPETTLTELLDVVDSLDIA